MEQPCSMGVKREMAGQHTKCLTTCPKGLTIYRDALMVRCTWSGWDNPFVEEWKRDWFRNGRSSSGNIKTAPKWMIPYMKTDIWHCIETDSSKWYIDGEEKKPDSCEECPDIGWAKCPNCHWHFNPHLKPLKPSFQGNLEGFDVFFID